VIALNALPDWLRLRPDFSLCKEDSETEPVLLRDPALEPLLDLEREARETVSMEPERPERLDPACHWSVSIEAEHPEGLDPLSMDAEAAERPERLEDFDFERLLPLLERVLDLDMFGVARLSIPERPRVLQLLLLDPVTGS